MTAQKPDYLQTMKLVTGVSKERDAEIEAQRANDRLKERNRDWVALKCRLLNRGLALRHLRNIVRQPLEATPAVQALAGLGKDGIYVLAGNVGCGKTHAGHVWLLDAQQRDQFDWQPGRLRMATAAWFARQSRYGATDKFDLLAEPERLVIDDLGVEFADNRQSYLVDFDELLDLRWRAQRPTLLTTNITRDKFRERYGERIDDRVRDGSGGHWFDVKHPSMRGHCGPRSDDGNETKTAR